MKNGPSLFKYSIRSSEMIIHPLDDEDFEHQNRIKRGTVAFDPIRIDQNLIPVKRNASKSTI